VHKGFISAVKVAEFFSDSILYIVLRGRWCDIIVLNCTVVTKFPKYHMNIMLWDFNDKVGSEDIFKPTIENEPLQECVHFWEVFYSRSVRCCFSRLPTDMEQKRTSDNIAAFILLNWGSICHTQVGSYIVTSFRTANYLTILHLQGFHSVKNRKVF
jgi:hypothetical protein